MLAPALAYADDPVQPGLGVRLVDAPAAAKNDPRARLYVVDALNPGDRITRRVEVSNGTGAAVRVSTYAAAAAVTPQGWTVAAGRERNDLASWTTVTPSTLSLPNGARGVVTVTVAVPANAGGGERYAVVLAELPPRPGAGVNVVNRVGIRMYVAVRGPDRPEPEADFALTSLTGQRLPDGRPALAVTVRNTGERALDLTGDVRLRDGPGGLAAGPFATPGTRTLAIGGTADVVLPLDRAIPAGPWKADVTMRSGALVRNVTGRLSFPDQGVGASTPATPVSSGGTDARGWPAWVAGLLLLALLGWFLFLLWRRRRHREDDPATAD